MIGFARGHAAGRPARRRCARDRGPRTRRHRRVGIAKASAVIVIGTTMPAGAHSAAVVCRSPTSPRKRGRSRTCGARPALPAGEGRARARAAELVRARRSARRDGKRATTSCRRDVFAALAASHPEFAGLSYDSLGLRGAIRARARRAATTPSMPARAAARSLRGRRTCRRAVACLVPRDAREDAHRLHGVHGRRRAAHPGRAQDLGVDAGPARPNRVRQGLLQPAADGLKNIMKEETIPGA